MRHGKAHRKLNRTAEHRRAMFGQHGCGADQARADRDHVAEGEGPASDRREAGHARQARRPACPPPGDRADPRRRHGQEALRGARPALQGPQRRLYPRAQGRLPLRRQRARRGDRIRRSRRRRQGSQFRSGAGEEGRGRSRSRLRNASASPVCKGPLGPFCLPSEARVAAQLLHCIAGTRFRVESHNAARIARRLHG